jgi:type VI secretion system protein ImpH
MAGAHGRDGVRLNGQAIVDASLARLAISTAAAKSPLERLMREPWRFEFFQAVRLIALAALRGETPPALTCARGMRASQLPYEEHVRFRAHIGHAFPASAISSLVASPTTGNEANETVPELSVTFFGLAGTGGVLPGHYTQLLIDRVWGKDFGLRDFWDLFNHRLIAQFYRAWEKCHFYVGYERACRGGAEHTDRFTQMLYSLVGMGTGGLRRRQAVSDEVFLYFAGHFSRRPRSAVALEQIVAHFFNVPVQVRQFHGQWMYLRPAERTKLISLSAADGSNRLGISAIAGRRLWGIENKFRVRLGILRYEDFREFLPGRTGFVSLGQIVRSFVGPAMDFDLQLVLDKNEVPRCQLKRGAGMQLGWNMWLFSGPATHHVDDAVFACEGMPSQ